VSNSVSIMCGKTLRGGRSEFCVMFYVCFYPCYLFQSEIRKCFFSCRRSHALILNKELTDDKRTRKGFKHPTGFYSCLRIVYYITRAEPSKHLNVMINNPDRKAFVSSNKRMACQPQLIHYLVSWG
jgi:hypothetical protein